jgi:hypothetical protein
LVRSPSTSVRRSTLGFSRRFSPGGHRRVGLLRERRRGDARTTARTSAAAAATGAHGHSFRPDDRTAAREDEGAGARAHVNAIREWVQHDRPAARQEDHDTADRDAAAPDRAPDRHRHGRGRRQHRGRRGGDGRRQAGRRSGRCRHDRRRRRAVGETDRGMRFPRDQHRAEHAKHAGECDDPDSHEQGRPLSRVAAGPPTDELRSTLRSCRHREPATRGTSGWSRRSCSLLCSQAPALSAVRNRSAGWNT